MKRRGTTPAACYELKHAVVRLERCDAGRRVLPERAPSSTEFYPRVIITDICRVRESRPVGQCSHPTVHKNRVKKIRRGKISPKSSRMEKTGCDMRIEVSAESCQDIALSHDDVSATETSNSDLFVGETFSPAVSCHRSPVIGDRSIADAAAKMLNILTPSSEDVDSSEMGLQDVMLTRSFEGLRNAEEEETDLTLTETALKNMMATGVYPDEFVEPVFDDMTCSVTDNEIPLLVSQEAEELAVLESTVPDTADPLSVFDNMPLLNVEDVGGDLYHQNRDVPVTGNSDMAEQGEAFAVPDHCSASFLSRNPSAVLTGLNNDVMLGDICNRSTLLEEEELLATSSGLSVETEESMDFCENDFALDEMNWNCEQTWPVLLDPIGGGFQVGQGSLNNSLDARDSDDEFKQRAREEFMARNVRWSLHHGSKKKKRRNHVSEHRHSDKRFKGVVVDDVMVTPNDRKFSQKKPTSTVHQRKDEQKGRDKDAAMDIPQDLDIGHEQKSRPPKIKQKQIKHLEDQGEYKMKPVRNLSLVSRHEPHGDRKEENLLEKKANAKAKDIGKFDDNSSLSKSLLKSSEAAKLKFSEMRKKKKDLDVDERPKKVEKVVDIKNRCRNEKCSSPAQPNSIYCSSECLARHVKESLRLLAHDREKSFNNRNKAPMVSDAGKPAERIVVFERKTGKLVTGPLAPTESSLLAWLQHHPTFEVLQPSCSSRNSKSRPSSSGRSKTSPARDQKKPVTKNKEDSLVHGSATTAQKSQKKEVDVNTDCHVSKPRSDIFSSMEPKKSDLENLKTKTQSELCHLLMARLKGKASSTKVKNLASDIHYELWSLCKNSSSLYRQKASSLLRIFKRSSSQDLCLRVLSSEVKPQQLVQNLAEYLHSEILSKNTGNKSMVDHSGIMPGLSDTTDRHDSHVFDLGCRICTRKPVAACDTEHSHEQTSSHSSNSKLPNRTLDRVEQLEPPDDRGEGPVKVAGSCGLAPPGSRTEIPTQSNGVSLDVRVASIPNCEDVLSSISPSVSTPSLPSIVSGVVSCGSCPPGTSDVTSICHDVDIDAVASLSGDIITKTDSSFHQPKPSASSDVSGVELTLPSITRPPTSTQVVSADLPDASSISAPPVGKTSASSSLSSPPVLPSSVVWRGVISAQDGANTIRVSAHRVSGSMKIVRDLLPSTIFMMGRIAPQMVQQYLQRIRGQHMLSHEISVVFFSCDDDSEQQKYNHLFSYLEQKRRCGVIDSVNALIKDMYIWPLLAKAAIPASLLPNDGTEFQPSQSNLLLGVIVHQAKQNNASNLRKFLPGTVPPEKLPFTQHPGSRAPSGKKVIEDETLTAEGSNNNESSEEDDDDFRAIAESDPIVSKYSKVKRNDDSLPIPATCGDEDVPYDPFDAEYELNAVNQVKSKVVDEEMNRENTTACVDHSLTTDSLKTPVEINMSSSSMEQEPVKEKASDDRRSTKQDITIDPHNEISSNEVGILPCESDLEKHETKIVFPPGVHSSSGATLFPAAKCVVDMEESREITTLSDANELFSMLGKHNESSKKTSADIGLSAGLFPESGLAGFDSKSHQEDFTQNTLDGLPVVGSDAADSSRAKVKDVKSAISELFRVDVLNEESLMKHLGQLMDSCGARTIYEQQKILVELIETVEKASDVANAKTEFNPESSTETQRNKITPVLEPKASNSSRGVLTPTWYEKSEPQQSNSSGNVDRVDLRCSAPDGGVVSAAEARRLSRSDVSPDQSCHASYQTGIQSLRWKELAGPSQHQQHDDGHLSYLNDSSIAENRSLDLHEQQTNAAFCSQPSLSEKPQTLPTIPSDLSSINIESILPILSDSSVETLKTIIMSTKSVKNPGNATESAHPTRSLSQSSGFSSSSDRNLCASSSGFSSRVTNNSDSFSAVDSSGLSSRRQFGNHSLFLPKDYGPGPLPPSMRIPPLFDRTGFRASFPEEHIQHQASSFESFPAHQSEAYVGRRHPLNIAPCHNKPPVDSTTSRDPCMPYLRSQMPWQSRGPSKRSDDAITHDSIRPALFNSFPDRMDICSSLGNPPLQRFRPPSSEREFCPFSRNNGGQTQHGSYGAQNMATNPDSCCGILGSSITGNANYCDKQNLSGESPLNPLHVCGKDGKFSRPSDGTDGGRRSDFDSTHFERNFSDNSYEFLGSSSEEILEKILPLAAPLNAANSLDQNAGNDNQQAAMLHCSKQRFDVNMDDERFEIKAQTVPGSDGQGCSLGHQFPADRTVGAARKSVDGPRNYSDLRLSDREFNWNSSGNHLSTGSRQDFLEASNIPGLDSENNFCESHVRGKQDGYASGSRDHETGLRRPGLYHQGPDHARPRQDFSPNGCFRKPRLDVCNFDGEWSHFHRLSSDRVGYEEAHGRGSWDSRISAHEQGPRHDGVFGAVPGQQSLCHPNENCDRLVTRPRIIDYGHRKQKYLEDQRPQGGVDGIQRRLYDIAKGREGGDTCQYRMTLEACGRQTISNEIIPISETDNKDCKLSAFSRESHNGVLYKDLDQARKAVGSRMLSNEPALLGNRGTILSDEEHLNANMSEQLRKDYCSNRLFHSKHFDENSALKPNDEQTFNENRSGALDDRIEIVDKPTDFMPGVTKELLAYLKSPSAFPTMQN